MFNCCKASKRLCQTVAQRAKDSVQEKRIETLEARNKDLLGLILYIGKEARVLDAGVVQRSLESLNKL